MEPERLGRYVIEKTLGRGAMGVVYLARDPVIGRLVALKTLTAPAETEEIEEFRHRFLREAQAAGILSHPGIVTVHDAGVDEGTGLSYIAMEYIQGRSLKELQKASYAFTFVEIARVGAAIATALDYAHARGVIHRDVKPANVIVTPQGTIKITDFGVARLESSNLTTTGQFIGTPNYMSPEQITGGAVDGRSDLFSLGVVLFELLTGRRPFVGSTLTEVSYKIVHAARPIPGQVRAGVPNGFNPIVLKLLEIDPARRYPRGAEVARALDALRRILSGTPEGAVAPVELPPSPEAEEPQPTGVTNAQTATSATVVATPAVAETPAWWRWPINPRWVAGLLAAVAIPVAAVVAVLTLSVDKGPWPGPAPGEAARRHRVVEAQRRAAGALRDRRPEEAVSLLAPVWAQAPYSEVARRLQRRAGEMRRAQEQTRADEVRAAALLEEGKGLLREGRWRQAQSRFEQVIGLVPSGELADVAGQYRDLARDRVRAPRSEPVTKTAAVGGSVPAASRPAAPVPADTRLELYFNSPMSTGSVELDLDGQALARKTFDFSTRGFLGIRRRGTGIVEDSVVVPTGAHLLTVRLRDEDGNLKGEQQIHASFVADARSVLKIEMPDDRAVPHFNLTEIRSR